MYNSIRLLKAEEASTLSQFEECGEGECILGDGSMPLILATYSIEDKEKALKDLSKYVCAYVYRQGYCCPIIYATEYALEYCDLDEDGEWLDGSDFDFAPSVYIGFTKEEL